MAGRKLFVTLLGCVGAAGVAVAAPTDPPTLRTYNIPSAAMEPTLEPGDMVLARRSLGACGTITPKPGEVIFHHKPREPGAMFVKRVVAGPGSTVSMSHKRLSINGKPVARAAAGTYEVDNQGSNSKAQVFRETLPNGASYLTMDLAPNGPFDDVAPIKLGADQWYALGDSRDNSLDSRLDGPVAQKDICGVAIAILMSKDMQRVGKKP